MREHLAALTLAGWGDLAEHERQWVASRLAARVGGPSGTNNPGGLRGSVYGGGGAPGWFDSPERGYRALLDASRRASFRLGATVPQDIPQQLSPDLLAAADSGDLASGVAARTAMSAAVRDLRQQWEGLDRVGVGRAILPQARPKVAEWRRLRDAWDRAELGDPGDPGWHARVGGQVRELVADANEILRAGVWERGGPEWERIERIRAALAGYRARHETSGVGDAGDQQERQERQDQLAELDREVDRLSESAWHAPGDLGALEVRVGVAVGWSWFGAPSDAARETFSQLMHDWADFEKDGVPQKLPWLTETHDTWLDFKAKWLAETADVTALSSMVADANRVRRDLADALRRQADAEAAAAKKAEEQAGAAKTAEEAARAKAEAAAATARSDDARRAAAATSRMSDITAPDIADISIPLQNLYHPERLLSRAGEAIGDLGAEIGKVIGSAWGAIPLQVKLGLGAVLGLGVYAAVRR